MAPLSSESYRPLSLLALAGFGLAVLYALVVVIGAAAALFNRIPWLMPNWTFLLPVAALVVCWAARTRIRDSEGTLSGLAFTTWGFRLTIVIGLTYAAYYGFTFFAVRLQATECADRFFEQIEQGHLEQAFLMSQGILAKNADSDDLRNTLQSRFNNPLGPPGSAGPFSLFRQMHFVRFLEMAGPRAKIVFRGVNDWGYEKGGYRVVLKYHVITDLGEFDVSVETFGRDPKPDEPKGLKWEVRLAQGATDMLPDSWRPTPLGEELVKKKSRTAQEFASAWMAKVNQQQWDEAYLDTLKPSERPRAREAHPGATALASRQLIRLDEKTFWAGKNQRDDILKRIRKTFQPGVSGKSAFVLTFQQAMPLIRAEAGQTTVFFDVSLRYLEESSEQPQYTVEGRLVVSAEGSDADTSPSAWHVESLEVESGRTPGRPRAAGAPGSDTRRPARR